MKLFKRSFHNHLIAWFKQHGRTTLPWQQSPTPYHIWISEIMLQQTQVKTVIPYFNRFITRFPNIQSLTFASIDDIMALWAGLGFYSRARNLHACAKVILRDHGGQFPDEIIALQNLPGIGRSTAGAILAFGFQKRASILDANVKRIHTRIHAIKGFVNDKKIEKKLWAIAETYTPRSNISEYTQAIMDLGALVCTPKQPSCHCCPMNKLCQAHKLGCETDFPQKKPAKTRPVRVIFLLLLKYGNKIMLEKRPPVGIWSNLFSLPEYDGERKTIRSFIKKQYALHLLNQKNLPSFRHTFSHFHLDITPILIKVSPIKEILKDQNQIIWQNKQELTKKGLPQPIKKLLLSLP